MLKPFLKQVLPNADKRRLVNFAQELSMEVSIRRLAAQGYNPSGIVDVGAYQGEWAKLAKAAFPAVPCLMIEAQEEKRSYLEATSKALPGTSFEIGLLAAEPERPVEFFVRELGSSMYDERGDSPATKRTLKTRTLDEVLAAHAFNRPGIFLKLDVQGAEIDVLKGGPLALKSADLVLLECSVFEYNAGAPLVDEILDFMRSHGFYIFDVWELHRLTAGYLAQVDLLFSRKDFALRPKKIEW